MLCVLGTHSERTHSEKWILQRSIDGISEVKLSKASISRIVDRGTASSKAVNDC